MVSSRMRKPPDAGRKRHPAVRGAWVVLALAGPVVLVGFYPRSQRDTAPAEAPRPSLAEALTDARQDIVESLRVSPQAPPVDPTPADPLPLDAPAGDASAIGSMQANLLSTTAGDRNHLFWRTIAEAGFACNEVRTAIAMVGTGSAWRANCGETQTYLIEVGEFGRLRVVPILYNDGLVPTPIRVMPDEQERTLQFRELQ